LVLGDRRLDMEPPEGMISRDRAMWMKTTSRGEQPIMPAPPCKASYDAT